MPHVTRINFNNPGREITQKGKSKWGLTDFEETVEIRA